MWDRKQIKGIGKLAFKANYWRSVLAAFLISILSVGTATMSFNSSSGVDTDDAQTAQDITNEEDLNQALNEITDAYNSMSEEDKVMAGAVVAALIGALILIALVGFLLRIFVFNPLTVGCYGFFRENAGGRNPDMDILKSGFGRYGHTFVTLFLRDLFLILWTCLFIVPGLVKAYSYRMVPFILRDNPDMSSTEVITASRNLMNGHKWQTFIFDLSYIGWYLLGILTLNLVNIFWTEPYRQNANGALYLKLIGEDRPVGSQREVQGEPLTPAEVVQAEPLAPAEEE